MSSPRRIATLLAALTLVAAFSAPALASPGGGTGSGDVKASGEHGNSDHSSGNNGTSGDPSQPQPPSNGDFSGHGANNHGAYDSTRDGSPSGNGNGGGEAVGKPCAGCVGKADNKNPPGQAPDGSDPNAGYECDSNHGIGRTNPAHTGCKPGETPPPTTPPTTNPPGNPPGNPPANPPQHPAGEVGGALPVTGTPLGRLIGIAVILLIAGVGLRRFVRQS